MKRFKKLLAVTALMIAALCITVPVSAAQKKNAIDNTLAVPPVFASSQYALLNPAIALQCNNDLTAMYNHYMSTGVRNGERIYATPMLTPVESLFLFMSYNRQQYIKNGMSATWPYFNLNNYIALNPDLIKSYGTNMPMYLYHYVNFGIYEGRQNGTMTDPAKVITWNPAVAQMGNAKLSPAKIIGNYTAFTGQPTTALLSAPVKAAPVQTTYVYYSSPRSHEHDWYYESIDDEKHWKKCHDCDEEHKEDHDYKVKAQTNGGDATKHILKCKKCDHRYITAHTPSYTYNGSGGTNTHQVKCSVCGYVISAAEACNNGGLSGSCTKCKHLPGVLPGPTHTHTYGAWSDNNNGTHSRSCTAADCPGGADATETESCSPNTPGSTCAKCGHNFPAAPTHTHTYGAWIDNNDGTHSKSCTDPSCPGGDDQTVTEGCSPNGAGETCSTCGHTFPAAPHTHTFGAWEWEHGTTHKRSCTDPSCPGGEDATERGACDHTDGGTCSVCGHEYDAP